MPGAPVTNWLGIAALGFVVVLMALNGDTRLGLYVFGVWFLLLVVGYLAAVRRRPAEVA
jgi:L-asparagine transporter-like permease